MAEQSAQSEGAGSEERTRTRAQELESCAVGLMSAIEMGISDEVGPHGLTPIEFNLLRACMDMGECTATQLAVVLPGGRLAHQPHSERACQQGPAHQAAPDL